MGYTTLVPSHQTKLIDASDVLPVNANGKIATINRSKIWFYEFLTSVRSCLLVLYKAFSIHYLLTLLKAFLISMKSRWCGDPNSKHCFKIIRGVLMSGCQWKNIEIGKLPVSYQFSFPGVLWCFLEYSVILPTTGSTQMPAVVALKTGILLRNLGVFRPLGTI